jgi:hypothetical protein
VEIFKAADGRKLYSSQIDTLINAMATFCTANSITWSQAVQQRPQDVEVILAQYWGLQPQLLQVASAPDEVEAGGGTSLTEISLVPIIQEAIKRWDEAVDLTETQMALLSQIDFQIADLSGLTLAETKGSTITLDRDAAGYGWFIDSTPATDAEFRSHHGKNDLFADSTSIAIGDMDLLSVIMHEFGHVLGYRDEISGVQSAVMDATLEAGERVLPAAFDKAPIAKADKVEQVLLFDEKSGYFQQFLEKDWPAKLKSVKSPFELTLPAATIGDGKEEEEWIIEV